MALAIAAIWIGSASQRASTPKVPYQSTTVEAQKATEPEPPTPADKWQRGESSSAMDDSKTVTFSLPADAPVDGWLKPHHPVLLVRCRERETDVFMTTGGPSSVGVRGDVVAQRASQVR